MSETSGFTIFSHEHFMKEALKMAQRAFDDDEVPIGAVVVHGTRIIGKGYNQVERLMDATAHAEMIAITAACQHLGNKLLQDCTIYVTIEPCPMCAGALRWAQPDRVIFGAAEPKSGFRRFGSDMLHPKTELIYGILEEECAAMLKQFFKNKR